MATPEEIQRFVSDGLHKTRRNLLDLSGRNKLLNFKHTGSKIIRIVDELPNQIYKELLSNADNEQKGGFTLSPVPLPKRSEYPDLEEVKDLQKIDVKSHARKLGISTEWVMQASSQSTEAKHQDDKLQTLLYPEDLDRLVRRIQSEARTAIEESGVNMLFLCLGFLKWSDTKNSDVFHHSPLIMIPIELERDKKINAKTGFANYRVKYTGEDILDNICLREKLGQFAIELPSFEEFESPEEYFSALSEILKDIKPEWAIERFITAGFLSFGKMLMYLDLDPARWPEIGGIADSAHIVDIFTGNHSPNGTVANEFEIDTDKSLPKLPHVMDADSSQHSAIIDVLNGKNIVIEGPPGTGKSQTITNLIAALLAEGKTVLFVAEKLAALQVVRKRLDGVGLGDFCLELHSHKTQKKTMMADLKKRLDMSTHKFRNAASEVEARMTELNQHKRKLIEYSNAVNRPFGGTEETPHQIFWKTGVLQKELSQEYKAESFAAPSNIIKLTIPALRGNVEIVKNLADKLRDYFESDFKSSEHFWQGINLAGPVDYAKQEDIFRGLQRLGKAAAAALNAVPKLAGYGLSEDAYVNYRDMSSDIEAFAESEFSQAYLLDGVNGENLNARIQALQAKFDNYTDALERNGFAFKIYSVEPYQIDGLVTQVNIEDLNFSESLTFKELDQSIETINKAVLKFEEAASTFREGAVYLNLGDENVTLDLLNAIQRASEISSLIDKSALVHRNPLIENAIGNPALDEIIKTVSFLRADKKNLEEYFIFDNLPSTERLKEILLSLKDKTMFSVLSSTWRSAYSDFKKIAINKREKDYRLAALKVQALIQHKQDADTFTKNQTYNSMLQSLFQGMDTDVDSLKLAITFYETIKQGVLNLPTFGTRVYTSIKNQDGLIFDWFAQYKNSIAESLQALVTINSIVNSTEQTSGTSKEISLLLDKVKNSAISFCQFKKVADELGVPSNLNLTIVKELQKSNIALNATNDELSKDALRQSLNLEISSTILEVHKSTLESLSDLGKKVDKTFSSEVHPYILCSDGYTNLQQIKALTDCFSEYLSSQKALRSSIPDLLNIKEFWKIQKFEEYSMLKCMAEKLVNIDSEVSAFDKWCDIVNSFAEVKSAGLEEIIHSFAKSISPQVPFSDYVSLYVYLAYAALSNEALRQHKELGSFARISHENVRNSFKAIDLELQKLNSQRLAHTISRRQLPEGSGGRTPRDFSDAHLIRHEVGKQKAHIPIRKLVARSYDALVAMKPCFMMGPLSVAQYLAPSHEKFDVLIMDEASQVKPEDAVGILARAKQVVVVGDSNQLPPTGFFDTLGDGNDDGSEETTIQDSESILDVCRPIFQPIRRLRWHYRSRHQSLISFSNHHFYDNDLVIFPSPTAHSDSMGVKHVYVSDGIYSSQSNPIEAQRLVEDITHMVTAFPDRSYGIVTLNAKQKMIIEDEIERVRKENPIFDKFITESETTDEGLFVKNLENVQGDERDVIYISTTFGPDETGSFRQNFGPINGKDGWRRLNVLFTRAKLHVRIFSSFYGDRIKVDDTKEQRGLRALKDYLQFAATGIDNHAYRTQKEPDSDFERAVGSFLRSKGYEVTYQLGVAGYLIDMVISHPQKNSDYVIAIECDGATYHSARSARDRDRLRESNLKNLGWTHIHRIWSTDWFKRQSQEEDRLLKAVDEAIKDHDARFDSAQVLPLSRARAT